MELEYLATTLSHLEALQPNEDRIQHVNAIRAMAMAYKLPLEEFTKKMTRYESSLDHWQGESRCILLLVKRRSGLLHLPRTWRGMSCCCGQARQHQSS